MSKYLITLTPLGKFFFGGDMTFQVGKDKKDSFNTEYSSYIIKSNKYPQQTSLLGMLRYLLLSKDETAFDRNKKEIIDTQVAKILIGEKGFCVNGENDFGMIKMLHPCFLQKKQSNNNWQNLLPAPKNLGYEIFFNHKMSAIVNGVSRPVPVVKGYNPKEWKEPLYIGSDFNMKESEIYLEDNRIGIDKDYRGNSKLNAFYKQISYRLGNRSEINADEIRFAFYVNIDDNIDLTQSQYVDTVVSIGGDNSQFILNAQVVENEKLSYSESYLKEYLETCKSNNPERYSEKSQDISGYDCEIILLSDSYLSKEEANHCMFSITDSVPFTFLKTTIRNKNYSILSKEVQRSDRYYLYQKGSVFYCTIAQAKALKQALKKDCFIKIGYNSYQEIIKK